MNFVVKLHAKMRSFNWFAIHFHVLRSIVPAMVELNTKAFNVLNRKESKKKVSFSNPFGNKFFDSILWNKPQQQQKQEVFT